MKSILATVLVTAILCFAFIATGAHSVTLDVVDTDGTVIGTVQHILESGPGFLLEIKTPRQTFLLPFVAEYVREVSRERGEIVVQNYRELLQLDQS